MEAGGLFRLRKGSAGFVRALVDPLVLRAVLQHPLELLNGLWGEDGGLFNSAKTSERRRRIRGRRYVED
ncbi:hypothetical protein PI125_g16088 [Phytophthora idaei]|nr:hypothetical protein PI125_g16088 [Phytophthora idaei]